MFRGFTQNKLRKEKLQGEGVLSVLVTSKNETDSSHSTTQVWVRSFRDNTDRYMALVIIGRRWIDMVVSIWKLQVLINRKPTCLCNSACDQSMLWRVSCNNAWVSEQSMRGCKLKTYLTHRNIVKVHPYGIYYQDLGILIVCISLQHSVQKEKFRMKI